MFTDIANHFSGVTGFHRGGGGLFIAHCSTTTGLQKVFNSLLLQEDTYQLMYLIYIDMISTAFNKFRQIRNTIFFF